MFYKINRPCCDIKNTADISYDGIPASRATLTSSSDWAHFSNFFIASHVVLPSASVTDTSLSYFKVLVLSQCTRQQYRCRHKFPQIMFNLERQTHRRMHEFWSGVWKGDKTYERWGALHIYVSAGKLPRAQNITWFWFKHGGSAEEKQKQKQTTNQLGHFL